jgi:hypothetical protein
MQIQNRAILSALWGQILGTTAQLGHMNLIPDVGEKKENWKKRGQASSVF